MPLTKQEKRERAEVLRRRRDQRSDIQQLALLHDRGAGHCKEAQRLRDRIVLADLGHNLPESPQRKLTAEDKILGSNYQRVMSEY